MRTFLGKIKPRNLMFIPIIDDNIFMGIIVLASVYSYTENHIELFEIVRSYIGVSVSNALTFERTTRLSNELKFQNRLVQDLNDDLEKKVSNRTAFLKNIIDSVDDSAIYALDKDFRITAWNKGTEKLFGFSVNDVMGKSIEYVFSKGEFNYIDIKQKFELVIKENKISESGWRKRNDGSLYFAEITYFKMSDNNGALLGYASIIKEMTELKRAEDSLWLQRGLTQKILDSSSRALVVTDAKGQVELFNNNACRLLKTTTMYGKKISDFFENENELLNIIKYISKGNHVADSRFALSDNDGEIAIRINSLYDRSEITIKLLFYLYL
ncbi:MAG: PAS domain S-box protein, partial [Clostridiales bacterium]|jgi:PAS domain S-box-containing protein|nr:PAS domain S-box protein [Clostridiales bacterium]